MLQYLFLQAIQGARAMMRLPWFLLLLQDALALSPSA
jgi:hypothetical protein